ncbi:anthranilate phosphoribosyltransferase [Nakamurella endophytica]|uniref:Anthranilate phosphoribosyltransferase n=1 Tax=Nakamurella endophytica TaxID=1748367 RepID=A0A917T718_9ACTN|nr:anthranilate phosphoribosyltransferase [Nakamurella endophytica]GGM12693.1 anthranilate phosphoribosyltransferase [Nakamurella endophytica]
MTSAGPGDGTAATGVPTWPDLLGRLVAGEDLTAEQTGWVMDQLMSGVATPAQLAGFAVALRAKGETAQEVAGLASSMLGHAVRVTVPVRAVDIVGTGGDRANTVNISTMAAVVAAAAGAPVVKHGNRAASSRCGAADLVEALGVPLTLGPEAVAATVRTAGIGFCFAPVFHPSYRHAGPTRRELGIPTVFNFLGPLTNPAQPAAAAVGCGDARMAGVMAEVFAGRDADVLLFRGDDGLDELTTTTTSTVWQVRGGQVDRVTVDPAALGIPAAAPRDLRGGDVQRNVEVARDLFAGRTGPVADAVALNAGAALAAHAGLTGDLVADLSAGLARARAALADGSAATLVDRWVAAAT